jgi:glycosyltransferase involved in cell wall biosynthesis
MNMVKVSVIIPNYNHAKFLPQRVDSVLNQTYQDFEIVFLDDASTDDSVEVMSGYLDNTKFSHIIFNEVNTSSPFKQWRRGIDLAVGEYVWIAESDDFAEPTFLEKLVQKLDSLPSIGLAYSESFEVNEYGVFMNYMAHHYYDLSLDRWKSDYVNNGIDECVFYLSRKNTIPNASAVLFRKEFVSALSSDIEKYKLCGDWLFWIKILLNSDLAFVAEPLNSFRCHDKTARNLINYDVYKSEKFKIIEFLSAAITIPNNVFGEIQADMVDYHFSRKFVYGDFIGFYRKMLLLCDRFSYSVSLHLILVKKIFLLAWGKLITKANGV